MRKLIQLYLNCKKTRDLKIFSYLDCERKKGMTYSEILRRTIEKDIKKRGKYII